MLLLPFVSRADDSDLLADLHEEVVKVPMVVDGFWGKKELQLTATVFRPEGNGPFPLIVLSHGNPPSAFDRPKIGRYRLILPIREFIQPEQMADAIRRFAGTIRVPVLWHYAENDRFFAPRYIRSWFDAFQQAGGRGKLVIQPPFARDGHSLFPSRKGIPIWTKEFDGFLDEFGINGRSPNPTD